jgi:stage II sporulation protein D
MNRWLSCSLLALLMAALAVRAADEFSGADKLRAIYSAEFRFTKDGLPVVPVAIAYGLHSVTVSAGPGGLRLLPEGDGGAEIRADDTWDIRASATSAARLRYYSVVWRGPVARGQDADAQMALWKGKGESVRRFEQGTLFGVGGEVLDRRESIVGVGPSASPEEAERAFERLAAKSPLRQPGVYTELVDRPHGQLEATGGKSRVKVRNEGVLWFVPLGDALLHIEASGEGPGGSQQKVSGSYAGRVYVTIDRLGSMAVVNAVPEDRLLAGLIPAEIFPSAPDEALKAQAVAARGELLSKIGTRHIGDPFRLCSQTHCQVYSGAGRETARTTAAVEATRGEVLFEGEGGGLADPVYSANCGGHTEHNENAWPDMPALPSLRGHRDADAKAGDPYRGGVTVANVDAFIANPPPAFCGRSKLGAGDRFRWTVTRSKDDLDKLLAKYRLGTISSIAILERGVSGRARAVRVTGAARSEVIRGELRIRQAFGNLRSSLFVVEVQGGGAVFRGAGFGHGVGMCQTGAIGMAEAGKSYREILRHYYPGTVLRKLW